MKESKELTEHLWSGIIHRSETGEVRKEDDVNILSKKDFYDYILDHYDFPSNKYYALCDPYYMRFSLSRGIGDYMIVYNYPPSPHDVDIKVPAEMTVVNNLVYIFENHGFENIKSNAVLSAGFAEIFFNSPIDNKSFLEIFDLVIEYLKDKDGVITKKK